MAAWESAAPDFEYLNLPQESEGTPEFEVIEGRGLDRKAREGLDPLWKKLFMGLLAGVVFVACLGFVRVQLTVWCVEALSANSELVSQVSEIEDEAQALAQEASTLASSERIERIATQNLGMVYVGAGETLEALGSEG